MSRLYSTWESKKKFLEDTIKTSESSTTKRRKLIKVVLVKEENVEVVEVREGEDMDLDAFTAIE